MRFIEFTANQKVHKIAILAYDLDYPGMLKNYVQNGLVAQGAPAHIEEEVIAYKLPYRVSGAKKKRKPLPVADQRIFLLELLTILKDIGVEHIMCANPEYFKTLTGQAKAALEVGSLYPPTVDHFEGFDHMKVGFAPNFKMAFYDPEKTAAGIAIACKAIVDDRQNAYKKPGSDIIKFCYYPQFKDEIQEALFRLVEIEDLSVDIEGFSLDMHDAGIASITFCWDEHQGIAFQVDEAPGYPNHEIRDCLIWFFQTRWKKYKDRGIQIRHLYHNAGYDVPVLIHHLRDTLFRNGVHPVYDEWDVYDWLATTEMLEDTKIITYLATNSTAGNKLGLKDQAVEFAGNYAVDEIKDITKIPVRELLEYNLVDGLSTWYVYNKHRPTLTTDNQDLIYDSIFKPSLSDIINMQLTGLPVDMEQVAESKREIQAIHDEANRVIQSHPMTKSYLLHMKEQYVEKKNSEYKKKRITVSDVDMEFNPGSDKQLAGLLFDPKFFCFPVIGKTESGAASTKGKIIKALMNLTEDQPLLDLLQAIIDYKDSQILLSTFIPALENARWNEKFQWFFMHGNFNLGGTVSGRLSSSDPNLQNIPAKSRLAKWIKKCIKAPPGWIFAGLDFDSLEDKISALITKDPNKLKVYTDGYDGHCLRAFSYFGDGMLDIDPNSVDSINSIAEKYAKERQTSKTPTFLLTYGGTYHGLMASCGFDETTALRIERNYHELYRVSDEWVASHIDRARKVGYVEVAFGLRVRTPVLSQTVDTERHTPYAAKSEARTAGNALGQSWGLLNNRAASEFMYRVRRGGKRNDIRICCQIHDAQYYMVKNDPALFAWFNVALSECVKWQDHPMIEHDEVKLSGEVSIFYPTWNEEHPIPNQMLASEIYQKGVELYEEYHA